MDLAQFFAESLEQRRLLFGSKLLALFGEVKDVDDFLSFSVDQRDLDVAPQPRERRPDVIEQPWPVLRHNLEQRAVLRRIVVEAKLCIDRNLRWAFAARFVAALQQRLKRRFAVYDIYQAAPESINLRRIQLQRAV